MKLLEVSHLHKFFGGLAATVDVSFSVEENETVGLIGPNGAGKTTLFNQLSGKLTCNSGSIVFKGQDITAWKPFRICRLGMARTFQLVNLFEDMTAARNVKTALSFGRTPPLRGRAAEERCMEELAFVGLAEKKNTPANQLTVGDKKRLEVARALATDPALLLLDEVMAGLTESELEGAIELINRIKERNITVLMIEHVMKAVMGLSDRIIFLHFGQKIAEGLPAEIAANKQVNEIYLGA